VLEAAINQNPDIPGFIAQYKPPFPVGTTDAGAALQYLEWPQDKRPLVPLMVFVDRQGIIRAEYSGADADFFNEQQMDQHIRAEAEKLLAERAAPAKKKSAGKAN
jgi:hypothetical protein